MTGAGDITSALFPDEAGIWAGKIGPFVIKTTYRPVFRFDDGHLHITGMRGDARFTLAGQAVGPAAVEQLPAQERRFVSELVCALAALNRGNVGADCAFVTTPLANAGNFDSGGLRAMLELRETAPALHDHEAADLLCDLPCDAEAGRIARYAEACRSNGIGILLRGFAGSPEAVECARATRPEVVDIDPDWLFRATRLSRAADLLPSLFRSLRSAGATVHVGGIAKLPQIEGALRCGANLVSGSLLAQPALAGALVDASPRPLDMSLGRAGPATLFG